MLRKFHFYLHIGTEKTGSTAIQIALLKNKDNLLDLGLAYLVSHDRIESRAFAAAAIGDKQKDDFLTRNNMDSAKSRQELRHQLASDLDSFISELPGHVHSIILSSEHFHSRLRYSNQVKWLYEFLLPYASGFTVICYVRPQVDLVSSSYSTMLKSYDARSLSEVVDSVCVKNNHYYNYNNFLSLWENVFGFESMVLRLFKADVMLQENVVADFFSAINNNAEFIKK
ncbi:hypothetical protein [Halomonas sp. BC1]|uniref:hypothetical protein n=1 Tax=Halomonas sp. BC1 TaxID=1670448 RepID=UPI001117CE36|nr:hypothetical protein [Halomonas sp. BC1]